MYKTKLLSLLLLLSISNELSSSERENYSSDESYDDSYDKRAEKEIEKFFRTRGKNGERRGRRNHYSPTNSLTKKDLERQQNSPIDGLD